MTSGFGSITDDHQYYKDVLKSPKYILAPMVSQSELAWRMLARKHGTQLCYTPMWNARTMLSDKNYHDKVLQDVSCKADRPLIVQFCANTAEHFIKAALLVEDHCNGVDLNLGCPQHIAQKGYYGAFLQEDWDLLHEIISKSRKKLKVGVSAKIRVFPELTRTVEYAKMLENAGCQLLTVHGRTREQKREMVGVASWKHIKAVKENVIIPVIANGNIRYGADVKKCMDATGVDGVMVAEGHLTNPYIFQGLHPNVYDVIDEYMTYAKVYTPHISCVRTHIFSLLSNALQHHKEMRELLAATSQIETIEEICRKMREKCEKENLEDPVVSLTDFPHWICQPYNRHERHREKEDCESTTENTSKLNLSKNQQKKIIRSQRRMENKIKKRVAEHQRRKERRKESERRYLEEEGVYENRIRRSTERKRSVLDRLDAVMRDDSKSIVICLDLSWSHAMNTKEINKLSSQLGRLYGSNRKCEKPAHLYFTGFERNGLLWRDCVRKHDGFHDFKIDMTSQPYAEVFQSRDIIYLTPDATTALKSVEPGFVYVLGGLVDETVCKKLTLESAADSGITTRRLPVLEYMTKSGHHSNYSTVYCVNQVFDILLAYHMTKDWRSALSCGVPARKGYVLKDHVQDNLQPR